MRWIEDLLSTRKERELSKEWIQIPTDQKIYSFTYENKFWIKENIAKHKIEGLLSIHRKLNESTRKQRWEVAFNEILFDWNSFCIPELYFIFSLINRVDICIEENGVISTYNGSKDLKNDLISKRKEIEQRIQDKERATNFWKLLLKYVDNEAIILSNLQTHPLMEILTNALCLNNHLKKEAQDQFQEQILFKHYFGNNLHLPLSVSWLKGKTDDHNQQWARLGAVNKSILNEKELSNFVKQLTGKYHLSSEVDLEYSEHYIFNSENLNHNLDIVSMERELGTKINEAWSKEERITMEVMNIA